MTDELTRHTLYRMVYGRVRDRMGEVVMTDSSSAIRRSPLEGLGHLDPSVLADPEVAETVRDAVDDALARRRPRW